jgi:hypothetical protein
MIYTWYWCREKSCEGKLFRNRQGVVPICPHCSKANTEPLPAGVDVTKILPPCSSALSGDPDRRKTV